VRWLIRKGLKLFVDLSYDPVKYKQTFRDNWNMVAPTYHAEWAGAGRGPFRSTKELIRLAGIKEDDYVLDLACGTGAVAKEASQFIGPSGLLVGIDFAKGPLDIARPENPACNFVEMDAEHIGLRARFDVVLCQYALMFFPEPEKVLSNLKTLLKRGGRLVVAVHGSAEGVPYFSTIMEPVLKRIPDIRPAGAPNAHRFGRKEDLERDISTAGFSEIAIEKFVFEYEAGSFSQYWSDYMATTAASIRSKIEAKGMQVAEAIRREAEERSRKYADNGSITFPWDVLVATARNR
jgi:ubiquinone/menaquinone biosynthesis C-methylase UbiE